MHERSMHQAVHNTFGLAKTEFSYCLTAGEKLGAEVSLDYLTRTVVRSFVSRRLKAEVAASGR